MSQVVSCRSSKQQPVASNTRAFGACPKEGGDHAGDFLAVIVPVQHHRFRCCRKGKPGVKSGHSSFSFHHVETGKPDANRCFLDA